MHGDLNGANIIIDGQDNVWMIDFFHTHRGHIIRDLLKLENDILFIFCKIESEMEWKEAVELTDFLHSREDLGIELSFESPEFLTNEKLKKAYRVIAKLRSYYPRLVKLDRDPYQMHVGALRYAMHTLSFDESNEWQRKWALYVGSKLIIKVKEFIKRSKVLRIDYLKPLVSSDSDGITRIGLTILPGRKDRARVLADDINTIKKEGITHILSLITEQEYIQYGVPDLKSELTQNKIQQKHIPILDQRVPSLTQMKESMDWMEEALSKKEKVLIHCVGGLGRSGTVAAAYLIWKHGLDAESAIQKVRESRSERAVESLEQIRFLKFWEKEVKAKI
ncbi:protein tyrosine phosphatase [Leptospira brenneri]|nr:protein tyrosine phosphatase [Leptospira brenneri]